MYARARRRSAALTSLPFMKETHLSRPIINTDDCSACGICVDACPDGVLEIVGDAVEPTNEDACTACAACMEECPMGAISEIEED